ncbi:BREX-2 system adenine-specific DNA-methyltransferase PglX [Microvirga pakistanensis]|uniref:BREX-2 system adenine-specific DNA-methyltransferase PglX n=2 Tax=Microvirga pakistanensis TaxID=1682650 RepID=UPI00106C2DA0|nr:BREX-2 system adenine-specific DNA-methyltransferase PglX [Microvirga pakistanensis]
MIDAQRLLADLKRFRKKLEDDLRAYHAGSRFREAVQAEWQEARDTKRTADTFETFFSAAVDQAAVHWILALVFLRFLEDNGLLDRPIVSGVGERLELAQLRQREHFRVRPTDSDAEYLLAAFEELARLPGLKGLLDPTHNPLFRLPVSGDGARDLIGFFRQRSVETGELNHDFTDPDWGTRFLGDLYQDLSEDARKRYALLQTPDFVEEWILSRTLDPALREFGHEQVRMIDPTCGSGHFLLSGFARLLEEWRRHAPDMPAAAQAQKALDAVAGVDLNPFAVEIARFRLLVAALKAAGQTRLAAAPDFRFQLATGDSLLHGRHFAKRELGGTEEGFRRVLRHHYAAEDTDAVDAILGRQYHAVVGNPPYITPKDAAMREAYREIYESCHRTYGLGAPFVERFFDLAQDAGEGRPAGFVGLIVANSFMKREFGKKLIEKVMPSVDLTHVVDCSGAYIPGHGTPTVILLGRNRAPVSAMVRTVRGVRGEPSTPQIPALGRVWSAIVAQTDLERSDGEFVSTEETSRKLLSRHPWSIGGGGASDVQAAIEQGGSKILKNLIASIGFYQDTHADEAFVQPLSFFRRNGIETLCKLQIRGDDIRDWNYTGDEAILFPYDKELKLLKNLDLGSSLSWFWALRTLLWSRSTFGGGTYRSVGRSWFDYHQFPVDRARTPLSIAFAFVATHNHFVVDKGGKVFNRSAPVIKLKNGASEEEHNTISCLLNSSVACFWMKQIFHNKGSTVDDKGARQRTDPFEDFYEFTGTGLQKFPLPDDPYVALAEQLYATAKSVSAALPSFVCRSVPTRVTLDEARVSFDSSWSRMIALQEELDWTCYGLYQLCDPPPQHGNPPPIQLGERAFEIVMARRMVEGKVETTWFERHRSTPKTELPKHWTPDYRAVVEHRIELIESDPTIGLIERPEYKRRWSMPPWEDMEREALRTWLLDRLEDPRYWPAGDPRIVSARALADATQRDPDFMSVAELYVGRSGFDQESLVAELVQGESVPFLAAMRYSESGLRKRADWEATWDKQRAEDAIDAEVEARREDYVRTAWIKLNPRQEGETAEAYAARLAAGHVSDSVRRAADTAIATEQKRRKAEKIGDIPVPPKYRTPDFQSAVYWRLRGGLDVPKERFVSFPQCSRDADASLLILWAGFDHLARAQALAALYVERKEQDGWPAERLVPMLAGLLELVPWLKQWHNDIDPNTGLRMGDFFEGYVEEEARGHGLTLADLRAWTPPVVPRRTRARRSAS